MADADNFKSTYQILLEISKVWHDLTDAQQAVLLEKIAGKHRASAVAAMLSDQETLVNAYADALDSAGSASDEFNKRTDSVEYHLKQLYAAWQELSSNALTVDFVNGMIDAARAVIELIDHIGALNVALSGLGTAISVFAGLRVLPTIEASGRQLLQAAGYAEQADHSLRMAGETASQRMIMFAGATDMLKKAFVALGRTLGIAVVLFGALKVVELVTEYFNNQKHAVENLSTEINDLESHIKSLKEEYDELNSKSNRTQEDDRKLAVLEKEIELEERSLELKKEQKRQQVLNDAEDYFSGKRDINPLSSSDFQDDMLSVEKAVGNYDSYKKLMQGYSDTIDECKSDLEGLTEGTAEYDVVLEKLETAQSNFIKGQEKESDYFEDAKEALDALYEHRENLLEITEQGTASEQANAKAQLANLNEIIEACEVSTGVADSYEHLASEVVRLSDEMDNLSQTLDSASKSGKITTAQMDYLKAKYPQLAEEVLSYCEEAEDGYTLEREAVEALQNQFGITEQAQLQAQINMTNNAITESQKRISAYESEINTLISLYNFISTSLPKLNNQTIAVSKQTDIAKLNPLIGSNIDQLAKLKEIQNTEEFTFAGANQYSGDYQKLYNYEADKKNLENLKKHFADQQKKLDGLKGKSGAGGGGGTGKGVSDGKSKSGSGSDKKDKKKVELWDKYAYSIEKSTEQLDAYDKAIDKTQAKLELNQADEERNLELREQEQELYAQLSEQLEDKRKATNDALWEQNNQLENWYKRLSELTGMDVNSDTLVADLQKWYDKKVNEDEDFADSLKGQETNQLIDAISNGRDRSDELYEALLKVKQEMEEINDEQVEVKIKYQEDVLDHLDEQRSITNTIYDMLENINGAEGQRKSLGNDLVKSYEAENDEIYKMINANYKMMNNLQEGTDEYNALVEQNNALIENQLQNLQSIYNIKKQTLEIEKEQAEVQAESAIYGEAGQQAWEDSRQNEIDKLQDELDALDKDDDEQSYLDELAEKEKTIAELQEKLNNLRNQNTIQQLEQQEDGSFQWKYVADQKAINETEAALEDARNDLQKTKDDKALEDQKANLQGRIDAIQAEIDERQKQYERELQLIQDTYDASMSTLDAWFRDEINKEQQRVKDAEKHWQDMKNTTDKGIKQVDATAKDNLATAAETFEFGMQKIQDVVSARTSEIIGLFVDMVDRAKSALSEVAGMEGDFDSGDYDIPGFAKGLKFVDANNMLARLHYGERVLTRQEATQYNAMEKDIKSGKLQEYFDSIKSNALYSIDSGVRNGMSAISKTIPVTSNSNTTQFNISNITLPNVEEPADFVSELNRWVRQEFGGLAQRGKIIPAR